MGFKAVVERDYPVMFGTLYAFGIMGLIVGILSEMMYVWIDPRIDFEGRR
jgi:microcin C transport system permease protein